MAGSNVYLYESVGPTPKIGRFSMRLGGGLPGFIPKALQTTDKSDENFVQNRYLVKEAWNTSYIQQVGENKVICTPFRLVNNAGDIFSRKNYSCGGPCQTFQSRPGLYGLRGGFGHTQDMCDGTGVPPATCNSKFVYDSSDYSRFLKQQAINRNYNDLSYGGANNAAQSAIKAVHRY